MLIKKTKRIPAAAKSIISANPLLSGHSMQLEDPITRLWFLLQRPHNVPVRLMVHLKSNVALSPGLIQRS